MNTKPFNLQKALNGAEVVTRDGRKVQRLVYVPERRSADRLLVIIDGTDYWQYDNGKYYPHTDSNQDLLIVANTKIIQVNLYLDNGRVVTGSTAFSEKVEFLKVIEVEVPDEQ